MSGSRGGRIWPALIAASAGLHAILFVAAALHAAPIAGPGDHDTPGHRGTELNPHAFSVTGRLGVSHPPKPIVAMSAARYADGAPPGFSGGFKEESCHGCHFEAEPNTPPGRLSVTGVPERFVPGQQYPLTVTLTRPGMKLGGFQLAARFEDGTQAGSLARGPGEEKRLAIAIEAQSGVQYANQRRPGAEPSSTDTATWTLVWTAPAAARPVTLHVAANAADNDESTRGDYVYTTATTTRPE